MHVIRQVMFDSDERRTLRAAQASINIAYPTDGLGEGRPAIPLDDPRRNILSRLGQDRSPTGRGQMMLAWQVVTDIVAAVTEQTDPAYFQTPHNPSHAAGAAFLTSPEAAVAMMIEIRQRQLAQAHEAVVLLASALALTTEQDDPSWVRDQDYADV